MDSSTRVDFLRVRELKDGFWIENLGLQYFLHALPIQLIVELRADHPPHVNPMLNIFSLASRASVQFMIKFTFSKSFKKLRNRSTCSDPFKSNGRGTRVRVQQTIQIMNLR